jgi:hypothetical protein
VRVGKVTMIGLAGRVEMNVAHWRHGDALGLKEDPFAEVDADIVISDGIAEHAAGKRDFARRERADFLAAGQWPL